MFTIRTVLVAVSAIVPSRPIVPMVDIGIATKTVGVSSADRRPACVIVSPVVMVSRIVAFYVLVTALKGFVVVPMAVMSIICTMMFVMPMAMVVSMGARFVKITMCKALIADQKPHNKKY